MWLLPPVDSRDWKEVARCHSGPFPGERSIPEVLYSAVEVEDPPLPVPKKAAP